MKTLLIIGLTFPEPTTTAAGLRMMQLISLFQEQGFTIVFASTASVSEKSVKLSKLDIEIKIIKLNDSSFNTFIKKINPSVVLFDRFISEEQFGWRVAEQCPKALRILDTEDLHFLRKARQESVKKGISIKKTEFFSETAKREIASIYRCDISLIISEVEINILQNKFNVPKNILYYLPFLVKPLSKKQIELLPSFKERNHFISIGNLLHQPNVDLVLYLKQEIWPEIRKQLPKAALYIYGAYAPQQIAELHNPKQGFYIQGWAENAFEVMKNAKICLAPLRYGAGLKGKLIDAMICGTPSITTTVGAEGIHSDLPFSGAVSNDLINFANAAVKFYNDEKKWTEAQQLGFNILEKRFDRKLFSEDFKNKIDQLQNRLNKHRNSNFIGQLLQHQTLQATKYMSKWIEKKNKK